MQFTLRDVLIKEYNPETAARIFRQAGALAGSEFCAGREEGAPGEECYELVVEDNGIGFDQKYSERIFGSSSGFTAGRSTKDPGSASPSAKRSSSATGGPLPRTARRGREPRWS
jgi:hypothetical protein